MVVFVVTAVRLLFDSLEKITMDLHCMPIVKDVTVDNGHGHNTICFVF
jgi:hypothetical protein